MEELLSVVREQFKVSDSIKLYNKLLEGKPLNPDMYEIDAWIAKAIEDNPKLLSVDQDQDVDQDVEPIAVVGIILKALAAEKGVPEYIVNQEFDDIIVAKWDSFDKWDELDPLFPIFDDTRNYHQAYKNNYEKVSGDFEKYFKVHAITLRDDKWKKTFKGIEPISDSSFGKYKINLPIPSKIHDEAISIYLTKNPEPHWPFMTSKVPDPNLRALKGCPILATDDILKLEMLISYCFSYDQRNKMIHEFLDRAMNFTKKDVDKWVEINKSSDKWFCDVIGIAEEKKAKAKLTKNYDDKSCSTFVRQTPKRFGKK